MTLKELEITANIKGLIRSITAYLYSGIMQLLGNMYSIFTRKTFKGKGRLQNSLPDRSVDLSMANIKITFAQKEGESLEGYSTKMLTVITFPQDGAIQSDFV